MIIQRFILFIGIALLPAQLWGQFSPGDLSRAHAHLEGMKNCTQCHDLGSAINETKCLDCHVEIESLQSMQRGYHSSSEVLDKSCVDCHSEHHGRAFDATRFDSVGFDHNLAGYELLGAHKEVDCRECHQKEYIANAEVAELKGTYLGLETACLSCHEDQHRGQLADDCLQCHGMEDWIPASEFDHNTADFRLTGAHSSVDCKECHSDQSDDEGVFAKYVNIEFDQCTDCHDDHHDGRLGQNCTECHGIWNWSVKDVESTFDHDRTRYPLTGKHLEVACEECHTSPSYSNLPFARCTDCHDDYHDGDFELAEGGIRDCDECHSIDKSFTWSSYGIAEHQESVYPLEGAHLATPCFACHQEEEEKWSFKFASNDCITCHDNVHEGFLKDSFTADNGCVTCHETSNWSAITFDHNRTEWPLEGLHQEATCASCHMPNGIEEQLFAPMDMSCVACHEDVHAGQFLTPNTEPANDCARCHSPVDAWSPVHFNHDDSKFPLEGKHIEVACKACHTEQNYNGTTTVLYKTNQLKCIDCHGS